MDCETTMKWAEINRQLEPHFVVLTDTLEFTVIFIHSDHNMRQHKSIVNFQQYDTLSYFFRMELF
jgi:hypothetical protein